MLMLGGGPALTPFSLEKFAARAADRQITLGACSVCFFYLVDSGRPLDPDELQILENLLDRSIDCWLDRLKLSFQIDKRDRFGFG